MLEGGVDERGKITDFGLDRAADDASMTHNGVLAGTPLYMAPEQAQGQTLDQRADLFSFGSVLYYMLTGRSPFQAPTTVAVLKRVVEDTPRPIREIVPDVPEWMCELIGHLHAKDSDQRYSSAKEVSELLAQCAIDLQASRVPKVPDPSKAAEEPPEVDSEIRPRRVESLLHSPLGKVAAAVVIVLGVLGITEATGVTKLASTVIRLTTGSGTLVIESHDPRVKIALDGKEVTIRGGGVEELTLRPGEYNVAATRGDQPAKQELVTITRNGRTSVRMSLESDEAITWPSDARFVRPDHREGSADASPNAPTLKKTLVGHTSSIYTVGYSPNGRWLASTGDGEVFVWDMQSGELAYALPVQKDVRFTAITFSPDGQFLLTAPLSAPAPISIWEAATGKPAGVLEGHAEGLYDLSFSPDGQTLVSGGHESFVRMWDFPGRRKLRDVPSDSRWVRSAIFSSKGQFAFGQDRVFLAEADGKIFKTINKHAGPLCFSPDGRRLAGTTW
ncbi:MAG: serine/threonine-protein kinase, partial [Planctomycetes bacterium]|nr:serine/threonine-protein kinase [Planctomycetota bacterium]